MSAQSVSPSTIGLAITRNTSHYKFTWTDSFLVNGATISWYCLKIQDYDPDQNGAYTKPCAYNGTYPSSGVTVPTEVLVTSYGYPPLSTVVVALTQKRATTNGVTYSVSTPQEEFAPDTLIDRPRGNITNFAISQSTRFIVSFSWSFLSENSLSTGGLSITSYYVERNCSGCTTTGWTPLLQNQAVNSLSLNLSSNDQGTMNYNTQYQVKLYPVNAAGFGYYPVTLSVKTKVPPSTPLTANPPVNVKLKATLISFSWNAIGSSEDETGGYPITEYQLLSAKYPSTNWTVAGTTSPSDCQISMTSGWLFGTKYDYRVRAVNQLGVGVISTPPTYITTPIDPASCSLPTGMNTPSLVDAGALSIKIQWADLTDSRNGGDVPFFYQVEFSSDNTTWTILTVRDEIKVLQYTHEFTPAFGSGVIVYYRIRPENNVGLSLNTSDVLSVTTCKVPQAMNTLTLEDVTPVNIVISWLDLTTEAKNGGDFPSFYQVEWSPNNSSWTVLNDGGPLSLAYNHVVETPFAPNSFQYYRVIPWNRVGQGIKYSAVLKVECDDIPSGMTKLVLETVNPTDITISWPELTSTSLNGGDLPNFYSVEYKKAAATNWTVLNEGGSWALSHTYAPGEILDENSTYQFRVRAQNRAGISNVYSSVLTVVTDKRPQYMYTPTALVQNTQYNTIKWQELLDMTYNGGDIPIFYYLEYSADKNIWHELNRDGQLWLNYSCWPGTILTKKSYYRVRAENGVGLAYIYSNILTLTQSANYSANVCTINPTNITICFSEASDQWGNGAYPTLYQLEWLNPITYGSSCDNVPLAQLSNNVNPTNSGASTLWRVVSPKTGSKNNYLTHSLVSGALPDSSPGIFTNDIFPSNSIQCYRVRMFLNGAFAATPSTYTRVLADQTPYGMNNPEVIEINPFNITVKWSELTSPENGRDLPIFYQLEWFDYTNFTWVGLLNKTIHGKILQYTHQRSEFFNPDIIQLYRVIAENGVGMGNGYSDILEIQPDTEPIGMDNIYVISVEPYVIQIGWPSLSTSLNGGDQPYYYEIEWYNSTSDQWVPMIKNESLGAVYSYSHILTANYFSPESIQQYRVIPKNLVGWGKQPSGVLSVLTDTYPNAPDTPFAISIEPMKIVISWNDQVSNSENGRDPILYYEFEWDQGNDTWLTMTTLQINGRITTYNHSQTFIFPANSEQKYRVRSQNIIGFGPFSEVLTVIADGPPTKSNTPTATSIEPKKVVLKWNPVTKDSDCGRDPIRYYRLDYLIRPCYADWSFDCLTESMSIATWQEITVQTVQYTNTTFTHSFNYVLKPDENFFYRVCPMNGVGYGVCSESFSMLSDSTPKFMNTPIVDTSNVQPSSIYLTWAGIYSDLETGRDSIIFYDLQYDNGSNMTTWTSLINESAGLLYTFNHTIVGLFPNGGNVNYRLRAKNGVGYGVYSNIMTVLCDSVPQTMNQPLVDTNHISPTWIYLTWNAMTNCQLTGRDCPISYGLEWDQGNDTWKNLTNPSGGLITHFNLTFSQAYASGQTFKFRTYAVNRVGNGAYSSVLTVVGDQVPTFMNAPVLLDVYPRWITLRWDDITLPAQTGGDSANYYQLFWDQGLNGEFIPVFTTDQVSSLVNTFNVSSLNNQTFSSGQVIQFKVRARNGIGFGALSNPLYVTCDMVPQLMFAPYITSQIDDVDPYWIKVYWDEVLYAPDNGGDEVTFYGLEWDQGNNTWANLTSPELGKVTSFVAHSGQDPFKSGQIIKFRAYAKNGVGYGDYSQNFEVQTDMVPQYMSQPYVLFDEDHIKPTSITLQWDALELPVLTGGDPVIYYEIQWDQGKFELDPDGCWITINPIIAQQPPQFTFNFTVAQHFSSNSTQKFRARGQNKVGPGLWSTILSVQSDSVPLYMNSPQIDEAAGHINPNWIFITWDAITEIYQTGGDLPLSYSIEWDQGNGTWKNVTPSEQTSLSYSFNFTQLDKPFPNGKTIAFRAFATNGVGSGAYSAVTTIIADSVPVYMNAPQVVGDGIHPHWLHVSWQGISDYLTETGRDPAIFYGLEWDQGNQTWVNLTTADMGEIYEFNITSGTKPFPSGMLIQMRAYAKNGVGFGAYSDILTIQADKIPQFMNQPVVDFASNHINPTWIYITWSPISGVEQNGGDEATFYGLEWDQANGTWANLTTPSLGEIFAFNLTAPNPPFASACQIQLRTYAKNGVGYGAYSSILTITTDSIPLFMNQPEVNYNANHINPKWIYITWAGINGDSQTGGDIANHYGVEWDQGNNTWVRLTKGTEGLIYSYNLTSVSVPFPSNMSIQLRALARNGVGFGAYSQVLQINADSVPLRMNSPFSTKVDYNRINLQWNPISDWADTGGDDIIYYELQFNNIACYTSDTEPCNSNELNWIALSKEEEANGATTFLTHNSLSQHFSRERYFQYRVCAKNGVGMGACSPLTKVLTDTIPQKMAAPTVDEVVHDQINLSWNPVKGEDDSSGRSTVVKYKVQWDEYQWYYGSDNGELAGANVIWKDCGTVLHDETADRIVFTYTKPPNFIQKRKVLFRVQAINNVGEGPFSDPTLTKTKNRYWSKARSWESGAVPIAGQNVVIPFGQNFSFDLPESPIYNRIDVNGQLEYYDDAPSLNLRANAIFIKTGNFWIGTSKKEPFLGNAKITLYGVQSSPNFTIDTDTVGGNKLLVNFGLFRAYGLQRVRMTRLLTSVNQGDKSLALPPGLEWKSGDQIAIAPSDMRYYQKDYAIITSYDNPTGATVLDRQLSYYHYGKSHSTENDYNGVDMRAEVYLLSRNIQIIGAGLEVGSELQPWGCQFVTSQVVDGFFVRRGQTYLDHVQISNCSQYGDKQGALRFDDSQGLESVISNSALHHGEGLAMYIENSKNIRIVNNTVFDFAKYGMNISRSSNIIIDSNHISSIKDQQIGESPTSEKQPAGILGCINSDCSSVSITNNVVSGVSYAGFIAMAHECGTSSTQTIFRNNIAHSINGWGAVMFTNMKSFTQQQICVEASYFSAYKCSQGGVIMNNATLTVMLSQMTLIDNQIGGTIIMVGPDAYENNTQLAIFRDSVFYGETEARDCKAQDACYGASIDPRECFERNGVYASYFNKQGKNPLTNRLFNLPLQKIQSDASYGGEAQFRNIKFIGFKNPVTYCGNQQRAIALNPSGADYHPRQKFFNTKFIDQHEDALAYLFTPPVSWIDFRLCGIDPCSGPMNTYLQFENTTYEGSLRPSNTPSFFQVTPYNTRVSGKIQGCSYVKGWNGYRCQNQNLAIMLFESRDADNRTRLVSPVMVTNRDFQTKTQLEAFMSHQEIIVTQVYRTSRFPVLVVTGTNSLVKYDIEYQGLPPQRQRFTLIADAGSLVARVNYPKAAAYVIKDRSGNQIPANPWDDDNHEQAPITGQYCGENRFDAVQNILEFYIMPNCTLWIEGVNVIQTNLRFNWTLNQFYQSGGVTAFKINLAKSLDIKPSFIKVLEVKQGSVIVNFQIYQAEDDKKFTKAGGLETVKTQLYNQIRDQTIWLGAPILNATVAGKASLNFKDPQAQAFEKQQNWNAKGGEVWVNQPPPQSIGDIIDPNDSLNIVKEVKDGDSGQSKSYAMVIGILLGAAILLILVGVFGYRRYRRYMEEKENKRIMEAKLSKGVMVDYITNSGSSPLKNADVTHFDEEAANGDEQFFHPSQMLNDQSYKEFNSVRKANEQDRLMLQSSERKTRDGFFPENGAQPTFGPRNPEVSSDEEARSDFEKMSNFELDDEDVQKAEEMGGEAINIEDYEGELGDFEEEFAIKKDVAAVPSQGVQRQPEILLQQFNAKIVPEEALNKDVSDADQENFNHSLNSEDGEELGSFEEEEPANSADLMNAQLSEIEVGDLPQEISSHEHGNNVLNIQEELKIEDFNSIPNNYDDAHDEQIDEDDFASLDMDSDTDGGEANAENPGQEEVAPPI